MHRFALLALCLLAVSAFAEPPVLTRAKAARAEAAKRGAIVVPAAVNGCLAPAQLKGARCAEGLQLCREEFGEGSCDGYSTTKVSLHVAYEGEPAPRSIGVNGERPGIPLSLEAGHSLELAGIGCPDPVPVTSGVGSAPGVSEAERAAAVERARRADEEANRKSKAQTERCVTAQRAALEKERRWYRCSLLSVDACSREAFLDCVGNTGPRGLVRARWSHPKDASAAETIKLEPLGP